MEAGGRGGDGPRFPDDDEVITLISAQIGNYLLPSCILGFIWEKKIVEIQYGWLNALKLGYLGYE